MNHARERWTMSVETVFFLGMVLWSSVSTLAEDTPRYLTANDLSVATGNPSLVKMSNGSTHVPVWSLSGGTEGQSVSGMIPGFSAEYAGVKVEIVVTTENQETTPEREDVYRVRLSQVKEGELLSYRYLFGKPVRTRLSEKPGQIRTIVLEPFYSIEPNLPILIRIQREPGDPADTYVHPDGLILVKVTPLHAPAKTELVEGTPGYNSWPVIQAIGNKLVCVYSRGTAHTIHEDLRAVYARTSTDGGKTWTPETVVANTPGYGEVTIGKGLDSQGAMLVWVRCVGGKGFKHDVYRTEDGVNYTRISTPEYEILPMQITDVFAVSDGLMALWFAGNYNNDGACHHWGTMTSHDDGRTWTQHLVETNIKKMDWPTEQSAVPLENGRILGVARTEIGGSTTERCQFQLTSLDNGKTWKRTKTNIGDVSSSTPSLIYDSDTGWVSNYYYERGRGILHRRVVKSDDVFDNPLAWPAPETVALGSDKAHHAGNVNATFVGGTHYVAFYTGDEKNTSVVVAVVPAPEE